jgi:predicted Zn-dependent protease
MSSESHLDACAQPHAARRLDRMLTAIVLAALLIVAWTADRLVFAEPEPSPLFKATLDRAYSRFKESDVMLEAGKKAAPHAAGVVDGPMGGDIPKESLPPINETIEWKEADAAFHAGSYEKALGGFEALLVRYSKDRQARVRVRHRLGDTLDKIGRWEDAIAEYRGVLDDDQNHPCCYEHMAGIYSRHGSPEMSARMIENAERDFRRMIGKSGNDVSWRMELCRFLLDHGRGPTEALAVMKGIVDEDPKPAAVLLLARALDRNGEPKEALAVLARRAPTEERDRKRFDEMRAQLESRIAR